MIRPDVLSGKLQKGPEIRSAIKAAIVDILTTRGGNTELNLGDRYVALAPLG